MRRPQNVAVLSHDQSGGVDQLGWADPAHQPQIIQQSHLYRCSDTWWPPITSHSRIMVAIPLYLYLFVRPPSPISAGNVDTLVAYDFTSALTYQKFTGPVWDLAGRGSVSESRKACWNYRFGTRFYCSCRPLCQIFTACRHKGCIPLYGGVPRIRYDYITLDARSPRHRELIIPDRLTDGETEPSPHILATPRGPNPGWAYASSLVRAQISQLAPTVSCRLA